MLINKVVKPQLSNFYVFLLNNAKKFLVFFSENINIKDVVNQLIQNKRHSFFKKV